jgi:hypothetical protein
MIYQAVLASTLCAAIVSAACSRSTLQSAVASYLQAQAVGTPNLILQAKNVSYAENDVVTNISTGVLSQPITIDFSRSIFDTTECSTFTEITAATDKHPYVIDTRMTISGDGVVSEIQSVVADSGDWVFNATSQLRWTKSETWDPIPDSKRDTRAIIKAAGDAYLDSWKDGTVKAPYGSSLSSPPLSIPHTYFPGTPCARLEGGAYTGERNATSNSCFMPVFPQPFIDAGGAKNRRYVVDEDMGAVGILNDFPFIDATRPMGTPSTNFLRVEEGKIRYIHETTICATRGCGR